MEKGLSRKALDFKNLDEDRLRLISKSIFLYSLVITNKLLRRNMVMVDKDILQQG